MANSFESTVFPQQSSTTITNELGFVDRRQNTGQLGNGVERRQFGNTYKDLSDDGRELATAIDNYKVDHRRRFITFDEMLVVIKSLGYQRSEG